MACSGGEQLVAMLESLRGSLSRKPQEDETGDLQGYLDETGILKTPALFLNHVSYLLKIQHATGSRLALIIKKRRKTLVPCFSIIRNPHLKNALIRMRTVSFERGTPVSL